MKAWNESPRRDGKNGRDPRHSDGYVSNSGLFIFPKHTVRHRFGTDPRHGHDRTRRDWTTTRSGSL